MKLYYVKAADAALRWQGTQDDAKKLARASGDPKLQQDRSWELVEVPVDKPGLLVFLNAMEMNLLNYAPQPDPIEQAELRAVAAQQPATTMSRDAQRPITTTDIERFILDHASVAQVEDIFAALGTRFREVTNGTS